ncbi:unnamed protein product [Closterium sp. Naga37s-1]|nr:unnamed protein product [Closterium sp. Naga37s-1]
MAGRSSSSSRRVPVQVTATLKSLQREYGSLYNIVRLSIRTDLPDMPPSGLFDEPMDDPAETLAAQAAADAAAGGLEEGVEAAGRPLDAALAYSYDAQRDSAAALGSMLEIQQRVQQQISAMSAAGSALGPHSTSPSQPTASNPSNPSAHSSQPAIPSSTAATAAAAASVAAAGGGSSPFASLWKNMASQLSRAFETLLPPPSPDDAPLGGSTGAGGIAARTAAGAAGASGAAGAAGAAGIEAGAAAAALTGIGGGAVAGAGGVGLVVGESGVAAVEEAWGGNVQSGSNGVIDITPQAPLAGAQSSLVRLAGEVRSNDALISSVNREMEEERQRLLNKAQSVAQEVQQRVTVGDMEAVVGAAVETMQSELQAAQQRTRQLLIQVELKDREMRLRREEWEKERSSMVASLQQLVLAKGGSVSSGSNSVEHRDGLDRNGSSEEAELATAARLERVADVLGREIAKLRRDKRALESRAQLLTWRLEAVHAKLAAVFGELVGVREAMSEGRVEEGMAILEGVIGEVGRWTSNTAMEQGGQGMGGERGGVSGEEGRSDGEVVAGWWDDSPPGEWAEFGKSENELESGGGLDEERRKEERRREELMALVGVDGEEGGGGWTAVPGVRMKDSTAKGPAGFPLKVYSIRASSLEFVTNNGAATWDR